MLPHCAHRQRQIEFPLRDTCKESARKAQRRGPGISWKGGEESARNTIGGRARCSNPSCRLEMTEALLVMGESESRGHWLRQNCTSLGSLAVPHNYAKAAIPHGFPFCIAPLLLFSLIFLLPSVKAEPKLPHLVAQQHSVTLIRSACTYRSAAGRVSQRKVRLSPFGS